ncbi:MAG: TolC family protein [Methylotetracoccus sp.]
MTKFTLPAAVVLAGLLALDDAALSAQPTALESSIATPTKSTTSFTEGRVAPMEEPKGALALGQALALALNRNPNLAAFSQEIRAREAAVLQAGLLPNPRLIGVAQNFGNASNKGFDGDWVSVELSQLIELGGKRAARIEAAAQTQELAGWDYEAQRIAVLTVVAQSFVEVLGAQERLDLAQQTVALAERAATVVGQQVEAGKVSPVEETRARVALATVRTDLIRAEREREAARKRLAALWGSTKPEFEHAVGELHAVSPIPELQQLLDKIEQNPELARWATELTQRQALVDLAKTKAIPDLTVSVGMSEYLLTNSYGLVASASLPLPVFDRNQGGIQEAERLRTKAMDERYAAEVRVATALNTAYQALSASFAEAEAYKTSILPGAESAFDAVQTGYRLGKFALLDVLDTQRTLFAAKAQYLRALATYHQAVAEVERLIGQPLALTQISKESP